MTNDLKTAVVSQLGGYANEETREILADVARGGADAGWSGFTYYTDTIDFARQNRKLILERLREDADDLGESMTALVASFRCLEGWYSEDEIGWALWGDIAEPDDDIGSILNALAWYALERVAYDADWEEE